MLIKDRTINKMVKYFLDSYVEKMKKLPASLTQDHHKGESQWEHIHNVLFYAKHMVREFDLSHEERDILYGACILHDLSNCIFATEERFKDEYQRLYITGFNRSHEASQWHPELSAGLIYKYILDNRIIDEKLIRIAKLIQGHMSHWYGGKSPKERLQIMLCMCDYFATERTVEIKGDITFIL